MSRSPQLPLLLAIACAAALVAGCSTPARDVYSNKRNYFVAPPPKKLEMPGEHQAREDAGNPLSGVGGAGSTAPAPGVATPSTVPGLDPLPQPGMPALPGL